MKNKITTGFWTIIIGSLFSMASCSDMLEIDSNAYLDTDKHRLDSPNDSLYSIVGILQQLQQLGDRYVVLGELRGELMEPTGNADMYLQEIANFTANPANPYLSTREYYSIINNCNYFLQRVDTGIVSGGRKVMKGEYAVAKAIRAWTYLQLVLNYGKAVYLTEPILSIEDMNRDYPVWQPLQLMETLATDIADYLDVTIYPVYGGNLSGGSFIPGPLVAGDLFLWLGALTGNAMYYESAASIYYRFIVDNYIRGGASDYVNRYTTSDFEDVMSMRGGEQISQIRYLTSASETLTLPSIVLLTFPEAPGSEAFQYMVKPSQAAMNLWSNETYVYYSANRELFYTKGDLRGICNQRYSDEPLGSYYYTDQDRTIPCISKYGYYLPDYYVLNINPSVSLYRAGKLYLHYAEALNALGKPSLAFAVLKYGLNNEALRDSTKINPGEINPFPDYCDFREPRYSDGGFMSQTGMHTRGSGDVDRDTLYYSFREETLRENSEYYGFPAQLKTKQDSILFVDAMICKELGLETAFEGNRFHDLMRFAIRRGDNNFLAQWVGRRNPALTGVLMNQDKWFLPTPE